MGINKEAENLDMIKVFGFFISSLDSNQRPRTESKVNEGLIRIFLPVAVNKAEGTLSAKLLLLHS